MTAIDTLTSLGFEETTVEEYQGLSDSLGLSTDYPHKVLHVLIKGGVTALVEQNVSEDASGGVDVVMKHPAVLILESAKGRVAIPNHDDANNAALIQEIAGDLA